MSRACPFRKESALKPRVHKSLLHLDVLVRIDEVQQREKTAESVPETSVGEHISGTDSAVVGTVVHNITLRVNFRKIAREKYGAIEARVESA